jgi:hypothetical protein
VGQQVDRQNDKPAERVRYPADRRQIGTSARPAEQEARADLPGVDARPRVPRTVWHAVGAIRPRHVALACDAHEARPQHRHEDRFFLGRHRLPVDVHVCRGSPHTHPFTPFCFSCNIYTPFLIPPQAFRAFNIELGDPQESFPFRINGRQHKVYMSAAESHFSDVNLLGTDFMKTYKGLLVVDYDADVEEGAVRLELRG